MGNVFSTGASSGQQASSAQQVQPSNARLSRPAVVNQLEKRNEHLPLTPACQETLDNINLVLQGVPRFDFPDVDGDIHYIRKYDATYQGSFSKGNPSGNGIVHFKNGGFYAGEFLYGNAHGDGTYIYPNGSLYQGNFVNSQISGKGVIVYYGSRMKYIGNFVDGQPSGHGKEVYSEGGYYQGTFEDGVKSGLGTYEWPNKNKYIGEFSNGTMNGKGKIVTGQGEIIYNGGFMNGNKSDHGVFKTPAGTYEGNFNNDSINGKGVFIYNDGKIYEGEFKNSMMNGNGKIFYTSNQVAEGYWEKNHNKFLSAVKNDPSTKDKINEIRARVQKQLNPNPTVYHPVAEDYQHMTVQQVQPAQFVMPAQPVQPAQFVMPAQPAVHQNNIMAPSVYL